MRLVRTHVSLFFCLALAISVSGQQTATSAPVGSTQAATLLTQSAAAQTGGQALSDVTLTGTARRIAGADDDTGPAVFKALASGAGRADLSLPSGQRSEACDLTASTPAGTWSGPDRVSHAISFHNLFTEPAWFFPAFAIARRLSSSGYVITYIGHESRNGQAVEHISVVQSPPLSVLPGGVSFGHLSQVDFFLDSITHLPAAISFNTHPDNDAGLDIPVEVRFSDYRSVAGVAAGLSSPSFFQVPFHVQKFLNNSLALDFQAQSVTFNSGLTASAFTVQ